MKIRRRLGVAPKFRGSLTESSCPDIFELSDGRFAIIGADLTDQLEGLLPADASRGPHERIVVISRDTLVRARTDIPES
jgi:hypothetical protein